MYRRLHAVELDPDREIIPLIGSKEGIFHFSLAHLDPGDLVLVTDPGYITYSRGALAAGGEPYFLPVSAETGFLPDLSQVPESIARKARLLWLNYPNNPTAATASLEFFASAVEFSRRYDLLVCHDAAYTQITFDGYHAPSLLEVPGSKDVAVEFNTLSKSHNMAGWRVGALVGNPAALKAFYTIKTNADSGHFLPILEAALQALTGDQTWIAVRNQVYQERRDAAIHGLHSLGLKAAVPRASLYVWSPVPQGWTAMQFAQEALTHAGVSLTPGVAFGQNGEGFVRISLTEPVGRIRQAMQRLADWMGP
jgi:LL-diaminopimelate aminotransferase